MKPNEDKSKSDKFFDAIFNIIVCFCMIATVIVGISGLAILFDSIMSFYYP